MVPPFRILAMGRFVRTKGYDVLLRAVKLLEAMGLDFHLTLAGAGPKGKPLKYATWRLGPRPPGVIPWIYSL